MRDIAAIADELRREWLTRQVTAMMATLRRVNGESVAFEEELRLVYDIQPQWTDERLFDDALSALGDLLAGTQPLADRLEAWDAQLAHEGYSGHHTEHAIKEQRLYREQGRAEASLQLINAPECVISEGIADLGRQVIFPEGELADWLSEQ